MDCRTCQPTLIDLLYGELATDAAQEAQAHLKECGSCRSAFEKLSHGTRVARRMEQLQPPDAVGARLMQLAHEHASAAAALRQPAERPTPRPWQSLLDFVGRFAMARQVGMATIMLLIVAVGMWALPQSQRSRVADGGTVVTPDALGEAAPAPVVAATPRAHGPSVAAPAAAPPGGAELDRMASSSEQRGTMPARAARRRASVASARPSEAKREPQAFPASAKKAASPPAEGAAKAGGAPRTRAMDELLDGALAGSARSRPPPAQQPSAAPLPASSPAKPVERSEAEAAARPAAGAALAAQPCDAARMREYQRTVDAAPSSAAAGRALLAMARCRRENGEHGLARALLEQAARNRHVAAQARALLDASARTANSATSAPAAPAAEPAGDDRSP